MTAMQMATGTAVLATAAIPASELALSPEQIEAIGSWRLHIVLGAVAVIAMGVSARIFRQAMASIQHVTDTQAHALAKITAAISDSAQSTKDLAREIRHSPGILAGKSRAPSDGN